MLGVDQTRIMNMAKLTLTIETPFGTFTRTTATAYRFAAVGEHRDDPESGVKVAGARKGDPTLPPRLSKYGVRYDCQRYLVRWSETEEGARRNVENYPYDYVRCLDVYPVKGTE
jgi:hypothetical protein